MTKEPLARPEYRWNLGTRTLELGKRTLVMAILNVTPDSFSDGGEHFRHDDAIAYGLGMLEEGADIIDIGGESTRPGTKVSNADIKHHVPGVSAEEELRRVLPVIKELKRAVPEAILSIDTYKADVAREAVRAGAEIVNDVSAFEWDPKMAGTVGELGCGAVLMHTRGRPEEWKNLPKLSGTEVFELVRRELADAALAAEKKGVEHDRIVLDPGFGFGKNNSENFPLLAHLSKLRELGYPILSGTSRKSFIGRIVRRDGKLAPPRERLYGTLATVTASVLAGAHIVRVHDVIPTVEAVAVADAIVGAN